MTDDPSVNAARLLATHLHEGQVDKLGEPYVNHALRVAAKMTTPDQVVVALLHDALEDADISESQLRAQFGEEVATAVVLLTRSADVPSAVYYERIRMNPLAFAVKLADVHDNLDPSRLLRLDHGTASRLLRKYGEALQALGSD